MPAAALIGKDHAHIAFALIADNLQPQIIEGLDLAAVDAHDAPALFYAGPMRLSSSRRLGELRRGLIGSHHGNARIDHHGEHKIHQRAGEHHGKALPDAFAVKALPLKLFFGDPDALILSLLKTVFFKHHHVAAKGNGRQAPFTAPAVGVLGKHLTEAERKSKHAHAAQASDNVVSPLVNEHKDGKSENKGQKRKHQIKPFLK